MNPMPRPNPAGRRPAQKPVAAPIQAPRRLAAPKHRPVVPVIQEKNTFGRWFALIVLGTAGFFGWEFYGDHSTRTEPEGREVTIAKTEPAKQEAASQSVTPSSVALAVANPMPAPVPTPPEPSSEPAPSPTPVPKAGPSPFTEPLVLDVVASRKADQIQRRERLLRLTVAEGKW